MKLIIFIFLLVNLLPYSKCNAQTGTFIWTNGAPTTNPGASGARFAVDRATFRWYEWVSGTTWVESGDRIQRISGCSAPAYTPTIHQSHVVINGCTSPNIPEIYAWTGSAWVKLNDGGGATYTAGTGISISGSNVISADTSLLATQYDISNLGVSWPLLAPNGTPTAPTYSFAENPTGGLMFEDGSVKIVAGGDEGDLIPRVIIKGATSFADAGGDVLIDGGGGGTTGGNLILNGGLGVATGGNFTMSGGVSTQGNGGGFRLTGGSANEGLGGSFIITGGYSNEGNSGNVVIFGGNSGTGNSGSVTISGGSSDEGDGGSINFTGGNTDGASATSGNISFSTPASSSGIGGDITFTTFGSGVQKPVIFNSAGMQYKGLTTAQRDALVAVLEGRLLWNTTKKCFELNNGSRWYEIGNIIKASATLDFPSTGAHSSSDLTATVTGAAVGDVVTVAPGLSAITANSNYTAWVSAANTVTVRFNHYGSGGATNPASGVFNIIVTKF